jgi:hypothetical protein
MMKSAATARFEPGLIFILVAMILIGVAASYGDYSEQADPQMDGQIRGFVQDVLGE